MCLVIVHNSQYRLKLGNSKNEGVAETETCFCPKRVSVQSLESKQELSLSVALSLTSERAAGAGKGLGSR